MDEVPVFFDMVVNKVVDKKGVKNAIVTTTGSQKKRCTAVLCCRADGVKLPPTIIFKGIKTNHKIA